MTTKKSPSPRKLARRATKAAEAAQSPSQRRSAEAVLRGLIDKFAPAHLRLVGTARRSLIKRLPTAHEIVYEYRDCFVISYSPSDKGYQGVLALRGSEEGVRLYFNQGKALRDPEKLMRGSGTQARWIPLDAASTLTRPAVSSLIEQAIANSPFPFDKTEPGSVILRTAAAKKAPKRRKA